MIETSSGLRRICGQLLLALVVLSASVVPSIAAEGLDDAQLSAVKAAEQARVEAIAGVYGTVVAIYGNDRAGGGSGVLYDEAGYVLTNFHVVSAAGEAGWAGLADGKLYRWKLLGFDPGGDLAIIRLQGKDRFPAATIGDSGTVRVGDWAMAMGNPFTLAEDQKPTVTLGIVSAIERYQPGAGKNALVYGNCIQVDSSINPGNSGGPLFNLAGQVIGINGRGSFKERGRVNVGVGYAISAEQCKNFLPDLLATRLCMHGTLDAIFAERDGQTVCTRLNLDAPIAKAGLQLGDRLLEFDGQPIRNANHFTNIISTLPTGWPVEVVFESDGLRRNAWVRLDGLTYEQRKQEQPKVEPDAPGDDDSQEPEPEAPSQVKPKVEPGEIRSDELNREETERLLRSWRTQVASSTQAAPLQGARMEVHVIDPRFGDTPIERRRWVWSVDGRYREDLLEVDTGEETGRSYGFDGTQFWRRDTDGKVSVKAGEDFKLETMKHNPLVAMAALHRSEPIGAFSEAKLDGGDKAAGERAFRVRGRLASGQPLYAWFRVLDAAGVPEPLLLKTAPAADTGLPADDGWIVSQWSVQGTMRLPSEWTEARGLSEARGLRLAVVATELFTDTNVPDEALARPADANPETN